MSEQPSLAFDLQTWIEGKDDLCSFKPNPKFSIVTLKRQVTPWWRRLFGLTKSKGFIDIRLVEVRPDYRGQSVFETWYYTTLRPLVWGAGYRIRVSHVLTPQFQNFWRRQPGFVEIPDKFGSLYPSYEDRKP